MTDFVKLEHRTSYDIVLGIERLPKAVKDGILHVPAGGELHVLTWARLEGRDPP